MRRGHDELSTYGLLGDLPQKAIVDLIHQLVDRECLVRTPGDRPVLQLTPAGWAVMRGDEEVPLVAPPPASRRRDRARGTAPAFDLGEVDAGLFEHLRLVRSRLAVERGVPAYIIFGDATLLALAARRPGTPAAMRHIPGVGDHKLADLGPTFLEEIAAYCDSHELPLDAGQAPLDASSERTARRTARATHEDGDRPALNSSPAAALAMRLFADGLPVDEVAEQVKRARSTVYAYLMEYLAEYRPATISPWVDEATVERVLAAADRAGTARLRPIFDELGGELPFEIIRLVMAHRIAQET